MFYYNNNIIIHKITLKNNKIPAWVLFLSFFFFFRMRMISKWTWINNSSGWCLFRHVIHMVTHHSMFWQNVRGKILFFSLYEKHFSCDLQQMAQSQETAAGQMEKGKKQHLPYENVPNVCKSLQHLEGWMEIGRKCVRLQCK